MYFDKEILARNLISVILLRWYNKKTLLLIAFKKYGGYYNNIWGSNLRLCKNFFDDVNFIIIYKYIVVDVLFVVGNPSSF